MAASQRGVRGPRPCSRSTPGLGRVTAAHSPAPRHQFGELGGTPRPPARANRCLCLLTAGHGSQFHPIWDPDTPASSESARSTNGSSFTEGLRKGLNIHRRAATAAAREARRSYPTTRHRGEIARRLRRCSAEPERVGNGHAAPGPRPRSPCPGRAVPAPSSTGCARWAAGTRR